MSAQVRHRHRAVLERPDVRFRPDVAGDLQHLVGEAIHLSDIVGLHGTVERGRERRDCGLGK